MIAGRDVTIRSTASSKVLNVQSSTVTGTPSSLSWLERYAIPSGGKEFLDRVPAPEVRVNQGNTRHG